MQNSRLLTIFIVVFVDLLGFSLILPLLPYYAETYSATALVVGLLVASYAAAQFIGAPLLGRLSDRYGRRPVLLLSVTGAFVGFLLLGLADPLGRMLSTTRVIEPLVGAYLLQSLGLWAPGVFSALLMVWALTFAYRRIIIHANRERLTLDTEVIHA